MARLTRVGVAREVAGPFDESASLVVSGGHRVAADGAEHAGVREFRLGRDDTVRDEMVDRLLPLESFKCSQSFDCIALTLCSSCLTSSTWPSLKLHFTTSVSSLTPLTNSLLLTADQLGLYKQTLRSQKWHRLTTWRSLVA